MGQNVVDRSGELREGVNVVYKVNGQGIPVFAHANNHYAGHGPSTVELLRELWEQRTRKGFPIESVPHSGRLFS